MGRTRAREGLGRVETPMAVARHMVELLFDGVASATRVLDAGAGRGIFIKAIAAYVRERGIPPPEVVGVEVDPQLADAAARQFRGLPWVKIVAADFLTLTPKEIGHFDLVISNPPYISYEYIDPAARERYRQTFKTARGRFDMYYLFFEKALDLLRQGGRLVFITTEKYTYTNSATELRKLLTTHHVKLLEFLDEDTFPGVYAYPLITVVEKKPPGPTVIHHRDGTTTVVNLPTDGTPWLAAASRQTPSHPAPTLRDIAEKISPGVATGRDHVFIIPRHALPPELAPYSHPTVSGQELTNLFKPGTAIDPTKLPNVILMPYKKTGQLMTPTEAQPLIQYLQRHRPQLEDRYAVKTGKKPWYAFHENPPMLQLLKPKILVPDLAKEPAFYLDPTGSIIPRHSVYYIVPKNPQTITQLLHYLNSEEAKRYLRQHSQKAANGYLRLQTHVLEKLPIPPALAKANNPTAPLPNTWML
ncbi:methyltransferase domain-containing protein [Pyrobaculum sp. 3827-6]|uniref:Eco57I restriction-modification methylase domain-containing protein n=1 Tax=Pyrobaculum sp. 3827-6 TaxID=2983604 RepID=UPI0021D8FCE2|nr:TaqI-like C-terminal specificity domain-containing protein [Pyrobaculum sp. 3827-6]MCU7787507.1 methyltransferase domain-containing protein [Pyrobaculum sp. 3827-6]